MRGTELSGLDDISPFSKCRKVGRRAGDHHGSPLPNRVLCVDTTEDIYRHSVIGSLHDQYGPVKTQEVMLQQ